MPAGRRSNHEPAPPTRCTQALRCADRWRTRLCAACATLAMAFTPVANAADVLAKLRQGGSLVIAHREASIPFSYLDAQGKPVGYSIDLCMKVAEAIRRELRLADLKVEWLPVSSATRIPTVAGGRADLECGSTTNNAERRRQVAFSIPHFFATARMIVKSASGIQNWDDLAGKTVVSTLGTTNLKSLRAKGEERFLRLNILEAKEHAEAFAMVVSGRAAAFAMDDVLLFGLRSQAPRPEDYAVVGKMLTIEPYAVMLPRDDPEFKKLIDREIARVIVDNEIHTLYRKWFQQPIPTREAGKTLNLNMPMGYILRDSFKYPTDQVPD